MDANPPQPPDAAPPPPEDAAGVASPPASRTAAPSRPTAARRRLLLRAVAVVVVLAAALLLLWRIAAPRVAAARLLRSLAAVRVAHTPFHQIERLATQFGSSGACVGDNCLFQFQNTWLNWLHLAPATQFSVMLRRGGSPADPGGGTVGSLDMAMLVVRAPGDGAAVASALVFERSRTPPGGPFQASVLLDPRGVPGRTVVRLAPGATPLQRRQARAFNLRCLTRLGGCTSSRQLLPGVWSDAQRIQSARVSPPTFPSSTLAAAAALGPIH